MQYFYNIFYSQNPAKSCSTPKITLSVCYDLGKSYSKYESHPWKFATADRDPNLCRRNKKKEKQIRKKKILRRKHIMHKAVRRMVCLKTSHPTDGMGCLVRDLTNKHHRVQIFLCTMDDCWLEQHTRIRRSIRLCSILQELFAHPRFFTRSAQILIGMMPQARALATDSIQIQTDFTARFLPRAPRSLAVNDPLSDW